MESISFDFGKHRDQDVIFCRFEFDPDLLARFRNRFPGARWSRTHKSWYVNDTTINRNRLNLEPKEIGYNLEQYIHEVNRPAFTAFRNTLQQRAYSPLTIRTYLNEFAQLLKVLGSHQVDDLTTARLNAYFLYCIRKLKHSENQLHSRINAVKAYFRMVLKKEQLLEYIPRPKSPKLLPKVLSKAEVSRLFLVTKNLKHLVMLKLCYGMGLRVSEIVNLKVRDIDSTRMQVLIEAAKGKKDRYVNLPESILEPLRLYYHNYRPRIYLFEGQFGGQYTIRSVQQVFKAAMLKAGINKSVGIHGLRHSFATHLLEAGTDMVFIQKLLGHSNIKTTEIYAQISRKSLGNVRSPLDDL